MQGHRGKHQCQSRGRKERQKSKSIAFIGVSAEGARQGRVNSLELASLNNSSELWGTGAVPSCPVPGPGLIYGRGNIGLLCES